jgi:hypothetical protein
MSDVRVGFATTNEGVRDSRWGEEEREIKEGGREESS